MSIETSATKLYLRELPPCESLHLIREYKIPHPYSDILTACCVEHLDAFPALDYLQEEHAISISYWTYVRKLNKALKMFRKSHTFATMQKSAK